MQPFFEAFADHQTIDLAGLGISTRVLLPAAAGGSVALFEETTAAKAGPPVHIHTEQDEFFRVMEGSYEFLIGDDRFTAGPGDTAFVPKGTAHAFWNTGEAPGRLLFGLAPAAEGEGFFTGLAKFISSDGPPDVAAINEHFAGRFEIVGPPLAVLFGPSAEGGEP